MSGDYVSTADKIVVPFSDDESVTDDQLIVESDKPGDSPEVKAQRAEKRRERAATRERERKEQTDRLARLEGELANERAARARLEGYVTAVAKPAEPGKDPYQAALDKVNEEQKGAWVSYQAELKAGTLDEKRADHYEAISRRIEEEKGRIHAERAIASREGNRRQETAQQVWVNKYPDVYNNTAAYNYAQGRFQSRKALAEANGERLTNDMVDEVMTETMNTFKLGGKGKPARNERDRMSGIGASGGGGGEGDTSRGIAPTKELMKMATSLYSDLPPEKAFQKWVDGPGRQLRKDKVL